MEKHIQAAKDELEEANNQVTDWWVRANAYHAVT
jgi:hypothetical protein